MQEKSAFGCAIDEAVISVTYGCTYACVVIVYLGVCFGYRHHNQMKYMQCLVLSILFIVAQMQEWTG